jgi:heme-degrading monooxygenase HmoA
MLLAMAFQTARPGRSEALLAAALEHAAALRQQPGCVATYVLSERGSRRQVSISVFETEAALEAGLTATRPVIVRHDLGTMVEGSSEFRLFDVH